MRIENYIWWDAVNQRWDLTSLAFIEQTDPGVRTLINLVLRSWFIPIEKPIQLPLNISSIVRLRR